MSLEINGYELIAEDNDCYHFNTLECGTFSIGKYSVENEAGAATLQEAIDILLLNIEAQTQTNE